MELVLAQLKQDGDSSSIQGVKAWARTLDGKWLVTINALCIEVTGKAGSLAAAKRDALNKFHADEAN
jgi:hypothetical protein